ncbi:MULTISPECIES: CD1290 family small acid-soluble spore protein [Clostridia]|uniref:CD1290 family small acid-soluble spore protein n=1 Tax=Clostridium sp. CCUG 7971 TaxID=2811414 RepID=UPI001ABB6BEF|nr:CD1290 family small acid-soluble spore protein [Clostridium sp. CCUG 7971]MBO3443641.1 spore protein [Clostridium sp. CCUG 7971]
MNNIANHNARMALKQVRMEIAADYGMDYEYAFDIIENAHNDGALASHFRKLENKKNTHQVKHHQ